MQNQEACRRNDIMQHLAYKFIVTEDIPADKPFGKFTFQNRIGFLTGVIKFGDILHLDGIENALKVPWKYPYLVDTLVTDRELIDCINPLFDYYIRPFHGGYNNRKDYTSSTGSNRTASFRTDVQNRDINCCVFCFSKAEIQVCHLIALKASYAGFVAEIDSVLKIAGIRINDVQNGICLCVACHLRFDKLKRYIDITDTNQLVVRVVNETNNPNDNDYLEIIEGLKSDRKRRLKYSQDEAFKNRAAVEDNDMNVFFHGDPRLHPNSTAFNFHKIACLIWRLAGGAEPEDYEYYQEYDFVDVINIDEFRKEKLDSYVCDWINTSATIDEGSSFSRAVD